MMPRLIALKLLRLVPVMFLVTLGTFSLLELVPGDPAQVIVGQDFPEAYEIVREELNLDDPFVSRYWDWLSGALTGDLGQQLTRPGFSVIEGIQQAFPVTLELAAISIGMSLLISIPLGVYAALHAGRAFDRVSSGMAFTLISVPSFLAGLLLIFFLVFRPELVRWPFLALGVMWSAWAVYKWWQLTFAASVPSSAPTASAASPPTPDSNASAAPSSAPTASAAPAPTPDSNASRGDGTIYLIMAVVVAVVVVAIFWAWPSFNRQGFARITSDAGIRENLRDVFLPALTLALTEIAIFMRLLRADMMATLQEDFILAARAKGMSTRRILFRHALRPSSFSLITLSAVAFGRLIGGTVIVETIFRLPGMGRFLVNDGVNNSDYTVVLGGVVVLATVFVLLNTCVDIAYNYLDPRIRRGRR